MSKGSPATFWRSVSILFVGIILVQWFLFISVLNHHHHHHHHHSTQGHDGSVIQNMETFLDGGYNDSPNTPKAIANDSTANEATRKGAKYDGVAMTVMLHAPKWFHRRYMVMLHNVLSVIPESWPVQIFVNEPWFQKDVLPLHPGLQKLRNENNTRFIWTPLPKELTKKKPKEVMKSEWLWNTVVAENVLLFSGNGAFCGNAKSTLRDFLGYDYIGVPWGQHDGQGGDGSSHSFRHRSAMLRILREYPPLSEMDSPDHQYFIKYLLNHREHFHVADKATTYEFGGVTEPESSPFVVSGTQAHMNWTSRDALLGACPELKVIFPSLHEPSCFGAHPNGEKCKATICALQDTLPGPGC
jgi:hypothetical protein